MERFRTVSDQKLSLWQSAVTETINDLIAGGEAFDQNELKQQVMNHPKVRAAADHAARTASQGPEGIKRPQRGANSEAINTYLSMLMFQLSLAKLENRKKEIINLEEEIRKYSSDDVIGWASCGATFLEYLYNKRTPYYRDWRDFGSIDSYSVIKYKLPNNAKVAIIGDWGTGMPDAKAMLKAILVEHAPDAVIHLGDIYYSGTLKESKEHVTGIFEELMEHSPKGNIPVFSIPGNHDYYAFGDGFYHEVIDVMNKQNSSWSQSASYFCLQTEDQQWQFLGMDTGRHDYDPFGDFLTSDTGPWLEESEIAWHHDKLLKFPGSTILLSHHQLFSQHSVIQNGKQARPWLNEHLFNTFHSYFDRIAAWFWGHEHNMVFFEDNIAGLKKGRLVGCSAFEEMEGQNPYLPHNELYKGQVPLIANMPKLTSKNGYYYHGFCHT